jgi:hypothetical protein
MHTLLLSVYILCNFQLIMKSTWINYYLNCIEFKKIVVIEYFKNMLVIVTTFSTEVYIFWILQR